MSDLISGHIFKVMSIVLCACASGCTVGLPMAPTPTQNLSAPEQGVFLTLDLRDSAGVDVEVNGETLHLLVLPNSESLLALNRNVADRLNLNPVFFGLGSASVTDGDHRVSGSVVRARYRVASSQPEQVWALAMEEDVHAGYDGAISFGAIPASVFRVQLQNESGGADRVWRTLTLSGRSEALERERDYAALEFSHALALYQDPISANRKAAFYLRRAGRLSEVGPVETLTRLFENQRPHRAARLDPPLLLGGRELSDVRIEVDEDGRIPGQTDESADDVVVVNHDTRRTAYAPTIYIGRDFFEGCSALEIDKAALSNTVQDIRVLCSPESFDAQ